MRLSRKQKKTALIWGNRPKLGIEAGEPCLGAARTRGRRKERKKSYQGSGMGKLNRKIVKRKRGAFESLLLMSKKDSGGNRPKKKAWDGS